MTASVDRQLYLNIGKPVEVSIAGAPATVTLSEDEDTVLVILPPDSVISENPTTTDFTLPSNDILGASDVTLKKKKQ